MIVSDHSPVSLLTMAFCHVNPPSVESSTLTLALALYSPRTLNGVVIVSPSRTLLNHELGVGSDAKSTSAPDPPAAAGGGGGGAATQPPPLPQPNVPARVREAATRLNAKTNTNANTANFFILSCSFLLLSLSRRRSRQ